MRATILSPLKILQENALWGSPYHRTVAATRNRTESFIGFCGLFVGFIVQVAGYFAYLAHGGHAAYGTERAVLAGVLAAIVAPAWFILGRLVNRYTFRPLLVRVARQRVNEPQLAFPRADSLVNWGQAAGYRALPGERVPEYLERVFKVKKAVIPQVGDGFVELEDVPEQEWPSFEN